MPVLGFEHSSFVLPRTGRMSVPLVDMEDRSLAPKEGDGGGGDRFKLSDTV